MSTLNVSSIKFWWKNHTNDKVKDELVEVKDLQSMHMQRDQTRNESIPTGDDSSEKEKNYYEGQQRISLSI